MVVDESAIAILRGEHYAYSTQQCLDGSM